MARRALRLSALVSSGSAMKFVFAIVFLVLLPAAAARAQSQPLSPPERPPVPLTDTDQQRARDEQLAKLKKKPDVESKKVLIPITHISTGNAALDQLVLEAADRYKLDPCLLVSVMSMESGFNRLAVSPKGAVGLMQLMPATAVRFGVRNMFDARENVMGGASYLRWLLDRFAGDVRLALAGYNAGEGAVELYGNKIPPFLETRNYVQAIYSRYSRIHGAPLPALSTAEYSKKEEKPPTYNQIIQFTSSSGDVTESGR